MGLQYVYTIHLHREAGAGMGAESEYRKCMREYWISWATVDLMASSGRLAVGSRDYFR